MTFRRCGLLVALFGMAALAGGCNASRVSQPPQSMPPHDVVASALPATAAPPSAPEAAPPSGAAPVQSSAAVPDTPAYAGSVSFSVNVSTVVAATHGAVPGSPAPGAPRNTVVPATWYGYPSILPVIGTAPGWAEVRLAQRPNGSTTWVPLSDVTLSASPYDLVLDLATRHLMVYDSGTEILDFPAGVGAPDDPTVTGNYFIAMRVPPPDPGYGPFVLVTSAHSDAISDWAGTGDAIIAIHGPITSYDDSLIGTSGAAISHGCIRLHDTDLAELNMIPAGTPLEVISGLA
jgi:lipoprotein-anchoring transpeptidase ErfK/SrfK